MSKEMPGGVMPLVTVASVDETRNFYVEKLGFQHQMGVVGKDGKLDFVNVVRDSASIMFSLDRGGAGARPVPRQAVEFYIGVPNVDALHSQLAGRRVEISEPLTDQWWGDRTFVVTDPNGYRVWFAQHMKEPVPPPGTKIV